MIPVPGSYETSDGWVARLEHSGFKVDRVTQLGIDQPLIRDWHVMYRATLVEPSGTEHGCMRRNHATAD
jgi:hypothetical protein